MLVSLRSETVITYYVFVLVYVLLFLALFNIKLKFLFICFIINNFVLSRKKFRVNKQKSRLFTFYIESVYVSI
jgi:hypothetical protein